MTSSGVTDAGEARCQASSVRSSYVIPNGGRLESTPARCLEIMVITTLCTYVVKSRDVAKRGPFCYWLWFLRLRGCTAQARGLKSSGVTQLSAVLRQKQAQHKFNCVTPDHIAAYLGSDLDAAPVVHTILHRARGTPSPAAYAPPAPAR